ncbi:MAG: hypothetical protein N0E48_19245 [Candidatus Thiodiazotropha endolucinida]|nr:hypothetical protein [Candidatus Thiodiazotropha taylori]MCW4345473.1 hypothetical protein [Candidatus Thiodiazotropha endolucinida]
MSSGPSRDIRLKSDPGIERRLENAATGEAMDTGETVELAISQEEEEKKLDTGADSPQAPDSPPIP